MKTYPQMSNHQHRYLNYVAANPGCSIADVVRACRWNPNAGKKWIYEGVHRLARQGVLRLVRAPKGSKTLYQLFVVE